MACTQASLPASQHSLQQERQMPTVRILPHLYVNVMPTLAKWVYCLLLEDLLAGTMLTAQVSIDCILPGCSIQGM